MRSNPWYGRKAGHNARICKRLEHDLHVVPAGAKGFIGQRVCLDPRCAILRISAANTLLLNHRLQCSRSVAQAWLLGNWDDRVAARERDVQASDHWLGYWHERQLICEGFGECQGHDPTCPGRCHAVHTRGTFRSLPGPVRTGELLDNTRRRVRHSDCLVLRSGQQPLSQPA